MALAVLSLDQTLDRLFSVPQDMGAIPLKYDQGR